MEYVSFFFEGGECLLKEKCTEQKKVNTGGTVQTTAAVLAKPCAILLA